MVPSFVAASLPSQESMWSILEMKALNVRARIRAVSWPVDGRRSGVVLIIGRQPTKDYTVSFVDPYRQP